MWVKVEVVGELPRAFLGDLITNFLQVFFDPLVFGCLAYLVQLREGGL